MRKIEALHTGKFGKGIGFYLKRIEAPCLYHKLSDMSMGWKPADSFMFFNGKGILIEFKQIHGKKSFNFNQLELHQLKALEKAYNTGNIGLLIIFYKDGNKCMAGGINITNYIKLPGEGRKSIKWADIPFDFICRSKTYYYDVTKMINYLYGLQKTAIH